MKRRTPSATLTDTLFPYTTLFRSLSAIEEFSDLGSGFNVAMRDLDIRGAGHLLGAEQSGFMAEIGFEMYHKILDEAIQELKEEAFTDLFKDEKPKPYISFTQVDTEQDMHIRSAERRVGKACVSTCRSRWSQ